MNISLASAIEFSVGFIGIVSAAGGFSAWQTALSIRNDLLITISNLKQDSIVTRRRVKLLEQFAANCGFQQEILPAGAREDTDL